MIRKYLHLIADRGIAMIWFLITEIRKYTDGRQKRNIILVTFNDHKEIPTSDVR